MGMVRSFASFSCHGCTRDQRCSRDGCSEQDERRMRPFKETSGDDFRSNTEIVEWGAAYCVTLSTLTPSVDAGSMAFIALIAVVAVLMSASCIRALRSGSAALAAGPIWQSA